MTLKVSITEAQKLLNDHLSEISFSQLPLAVEIESPPDIDQRQFNVADAFKASIDFADSRKREFPNYNHKFEFIREFKRRAAEAHVYVILGQAKSLYEILYR